MSSWNILNAGKQPEQEERKVDVDKVREKRLNHSSIAVAPEVSTSPTLETSISTSATSTPTAAPAPSPASLQDRHARSLNHLLEQIFLITVRHDSVTPNSATLTLVASSDSFITPQNLSELIMMHVMDGSTIGDGATSYFLACYKRYFAKETTISEKLRPDMQQCKKQLVSFVISSLTEPELFGAGGSSALVLHCGRDFDAHVVPLLRDIADQMAASDFDRIAQEFIAMCYAGLSNSCAGQPNTYAEPLQALHTIVTADKRYARVAAMSSVFLPNPAYLTARAPTQQDIMLAQLRFGPAKLFQETGVAGCAVEHNSLFGRVLRIAPNYRQAHIVEMFKDVTKQTKNIYDANIKTLRTEVTMIQAKTCEMFLSILKAGAAAQALALQWLSQAVHYNLEAEKAQANPLVAASTGFLYNLCAVLLRLARPIIESPEKLNKVDWSYLNSVDPALSAGHFDKETKLMRSEGDDSLTIPALPTSKCTGDYNFITQSFFLCWKILHIGVVQECIRYPNVLRAVQRMHDGITTGEPNAITHLVVKILMDVHLLSSDMMNDVATFVAAGAAGIISHFNEQLRGGASEASDWISSPMELSSEEKSYLALLPEHLIDDLADMLLFIAKTDTALASSKPLEPVLSLILYFLRRPWAMTSPHLRAKLGQILYYVFLPSAQRVGEERYTQPPAGNIDGAQCQLLGFHPVSEKYLAPALLLLYGDVERTGYYEKLTHRRCIMVVVKHLWTLPSHRPAFRAIASDSGDSSRFIRFANGLLNETNSLIGITLDKLIEIKEVQEKMKNHAEWNAQSEETRNQITERHTENERSVKGCAELCAETFEKLNMFNYLTSDEQIRLPFLLDEILPRFTSMLLNVLGKLVGSKSLEIKVDNMSAYNFHPKELLKEICVIMTHFTNFEQFSSAVASDGFFTDKEGNVPLSKALNTVRKLNLLVGSELDMFATLVDRALQARSKYKDIDSLVSDAPDEFLDPIMSTIMRDPVLLPTSQQIVDRATISQHLLNDETDPFNRKPLSMKMVIPVDDLRQKIKEWLSSKGL